MSYPLDQVIATNPGGFAPRNPSRPPWLQPKPVPYELACTGNVATVPLIVADRAHLHGLDQPSWEQPWECPEDWTRQSWGVAP